MNDEEYRQHAHEAWVQSMLRVQRLFAGEVEEA